MATAKRKTVTSVGVKKDSKNATEKWWTTIRLYQLILFGFSFCLYFNTVFNDYNLDDELVTQHHRLTSKGLSAIPEIFASPYYEDLSGYKYEYRPIVLVSFAIENALFGENPHISHFINILLYGFLCLLLFRVLRELFLNYNAVYPFFISIAFAAHPIHTEIVASIKNRDEILALLFSLQALLFAIQYIRKRSRVSLLLMLVAFVLGILSKTTAIAFAFLIPLTIVFLVETGFGRTLIITGMLAIPTILFARLYSLTQQIEVFFGLIILITALYVIRHGKISHISWKQISGNLLHKISFGEISPSADKTEAEEVPFNWKIFFSWSFSLALLLSILSAVGIYEGSPWLSSIPFLLLGIMYLGRNRDLKLILIILITGLATLAAVRIKSSTSAIAVSVVVFLIAQLFNGSRTFRRVTIGVWVLHALIAIIFIKSFWFLAPLVFVGFFFQRLRPVTYILTAVSAGYFFMMVFKIIKHHKAFAPSYLAIPILFIALMLLYRNRKEVVVKLYSVLLPLSVFFTLLIHPPVQKNLYARIEKGYYESTKIKAADLTPVQSVRPLKFIEYPLDNNTSFSVKLGTALVVLGNYFKKIIVPYPLSFYYGYAFIVPTNLSSAVPIAVLVLYLFLGIFSLALSRKLPVIAYSILFFLASISLFSNLFIPIPGLMADRFLLIPSIGFSILVVTLLGMLFKIKWEMKSLTVSNTPKSYRWIMISVLTLYSLMTVARNAQWKDRITLFRHDIQVVPNSAQAQNLLGLHLWIASNAEQDANKQYKLREEAAEHLKRAIEIYPAFLNASFDLGRTYETMGKTEEAYQAYEKTIQIDTGFYAPLFSMAVILDNKGEVKQAIPLYEKYLKKYPTRKEVYANLSYAYFKLGEYENSIATNRRLLLIQPNTYEPTVNIAKTYLQMDVPDSAYLYFERSYAINPREQNIQPIIEQLKGRLHK